VSHTDVLEAGTYIQNTMDTLMKGASYANAEKKLILIILNLFDDIFFPYDLHSLIQISHYKGKVPQQLGDGIKGVDLGLDCYDDPFLTQTALKLNERLQVISNTKTLFYCNLIV
jgi:hypothetical protein